MKVKIQIDTQTLIRFWLVVIGFGLVGFMLVKAQQPLTLVLISFFLAMALNTPVRYIAQHLPGKSRLGATAAAFVSMVIFLGVFIFMVFPPIVQQTVRLVDTIPVLINDNQDSIAFFNHFVEEYNLQPEVNKAIASVRDQASGMIGSVTADIVASIGSLLGFILSTVIVLVMSFFMLLEGPEWMRRLWRVYTDEKRKKHHKELMSKMYAVMVGYVNGQLAVAAISGAGAGIFVFIISFIIPDVPMNLALPTMAIGGVLSLIPMFGATVAGVLIALMLLLNSLAAAIIFVIYFVIYQQIENNLVAPAIQSKRIQLSALAILIAVATGTYMFGIVGGIISIPIAGWIKVLVEDYFDRKKREHLDGHGAAKPLDKLKGMAMKATGHGQDKDSA